MTDSKALIERLRSGRWLGETTGAKAADRIAELEAENAKLREAGNKLADAAYHGEECPMNTTGAYCDCGYDNAADAWTLATSGDKP